VKGIVMNENLKTHLVDFIKWVLIIIIAAIVFYIVYPKYHFENRIIRCNKVTGKVEICSLADGNWKTQGKN
jgi:hypothetical protein